ncbi:hypothetical protein EII29_03980 [Leptotrichia sp. OH3620_COT-345]|uniref:hypothetical protein n=1 Tax=Leptotrichia sp. OH3620_COT-345 TaxID=2491048 RepID=UPI000F6546E2|nr:hypothetical protein [Leptotrichia sp. OH3620_COT-345]RRD40263.1 hypothetical protein EII29_03980 [Leptotrichia sp. OH3620_COT-345]
MKVIFSYYDDEDFGLTEYPELLISEKVEKMPEERYSEEKYRLEQYRKYLITGIMEDFQYPESCDKVLAEIKNIESGKISVTEWDGQAFQHKITKSYVEFIHTVFGECEEYPAWNCKLKEYKRVLQGWKNFLELPRSMKSKVEIKIKD